MPKKLKVYQTSIGFFDLAVAAPSMKAAAEAWGADPDIFKRGFAKPTEDPKVVAATMGAPGMVLRRPVGSQGEFTEKAVLPKAPEALQLAPQDRAQRANTSKQAEMKFDEKAKRNAAAALEKEKRREALDRAKAEAESERASKQRERMVAKANAAFERARNRHENTMNSIAQRRGELDEEEANESQRWEREQQAHNDALKEAEA
jgi:colicin import membrane protein